MATPVFHSGRFATAYMGSTTASSELPTKSWSVDESPEMVTFRNSRTGRFTVAEQTFLNVGASINIDYDFANNPFLAANGGLAIIPGNSNSARLFVGGNTTPTNSAFWDFPQCIVNGINHTVDLEGKPQLTVRIMGTGTYSEPAT